MRNITEYRETMHSTVYRRLHKLYTAGCDRCPYHRNENFDGDSRGFHSWKLSSTRPAQWKINVCLL